MPPNLDVYGLTKNRNLATIERFLDAVIDRSANEDRGEEELMLDPVGSDERATLDRAEWEPAVTLSHTIRRGLDYPRRGFAVYLTAREPSFERVMLRFTTDDQLIVGLSIDDTGGHLQNEARARALLSELVADYDCYLGAILSERAPPCDERAFRALESQTGTVFFYAPRLQRHCGTSPGVLAHVGQCAGARCSPQDTSVPIVGVLPLLAAKDPRSHPSGYGSKALGDHQPRQHSVDEAADPQSKPCRNHQLTESSSPSAAER